MKKKQTTDELAKEVAKLTADFIIDATKRAEKKFGRELTGPESNLICAVGAKLGADHLIKSVLEAAK